MSQYEISRVIKNSFILQDESIYRKLDELLFRRNCLSSAVRELKGCYKGTFLSVLQIVSSATLRWKKPYELLRIRDFVNGRPDSGCYSPGMCDRTVYRALRILCEEGILVRLTLNDGRDVHYALNFERILEMVGSTIDSMRGHSLIWQETERLYNEIKSSADFALLIKTVKNFAGLVIRDTKEFLQTLRAIGEKAMATIRQGVEAAKKAAREYSLKRETTKAARPIFRHNCVDYEAALALWHKEVRDTDEHRGYVPIKTGKVLGMMKNWLHELGKQGKSEEEVRLLIKLYVRKWRHVPDEERELQLTSASGKPYKARMPYTPNFEIFYVYRTALSPVLERTCEPGKTMDGGVRQTVNYLSFGG
jgi:hypothetical protein